MTIDQLLGTTSHRPYALPHGKWLAYQEWHGAVFLHWRIDKLLLRSLVPSELHLDQLDNQCYISLVAFSMKHVRPRGIPAIPGLSDFYEVNLRTYVHRNGKAGVYFFSLEANNAVVAAAARILSGFNYIRSDISRGNETWYCRNKTEQTILDIHYQPAEPIAVTNIEDKWLAERYAAFNVKREKLYHYDIHHQPWPLHKIKILSLKLGYRAGNTPLQPEQLHSAHYSPGVQVLAWNRHYY